MSDRLLFGRGKSSEWCFWGLYAYKCACCKLLFFQTARAEWLCTCVMQGTIGHRCARCVCDLIQIYCGQVCACSLQFHNQCRPYRPAEHQQAACAQVNRRTMLLGSWQYNCLA